MTNTSIKNAFERMWVHVVSALGNKSDITHTHKETDTKISALQTKIDEHIASAPTTLQATDDGAGNVSLTLTNDSSETNNE